MHSDLPWKISQRQRLSTSTWLAITLCVCGAAPRACLAQATWADSAKRGAGYSLKPQVQAQNLIRLDKLNVPWFYSWSDQPLSGFEALPGDTSFVPMAWGRGGLTDPSPNKIDDWIAGAAAGHYDTLLGFNEPDLVSQANMSVSEALDLWPILESTGLRLGSPATAAAQGTWIADFMQGVSDRGLRVDFMAVHHYGGKNPQSFLNKLQAIHNQYNLPIWVTELGVRDGNATTPADNIYSDQEVYDFMKVVVPAMEQMPYVERYAWFPPTRSNPFLTSSALFEDNNELTRLGRLYQGGVDLLNAGFESPAVASGQTESTEVDLWETFNSAVVSSDHARSGNQSLRLAPSLASGQQKPGIARQLYNVGLEVQLDATYSLGAWVMHPSSDPLTGTREGTLRIQWFDATGSLIDFQSIVAIDASRPTDQWFFVSLDDVAIPNDPNIAQVRASIFVNNVGATSVNSGSAYFDDLVFVAGSLPLVGDLDGDGFVGIGDLNLILGRWNQASPPGVWPLGDPSGDGFIGIEDLNVVLGNWNAGTPPLAEALSQIPEPSALGLMACGMVVMTSRHRRRC